MTKYSKPKFIYPVILVFFCIVFSVQLASAEEIPAYSLTYPPPVEGMPTEKPAADSDIQDLVLTPKSAAYENIPQSTGFDYPVGGASNHDGFEMVNCFGCTYMWMIGHTGEDFYDGMSGEPVY